MYVAQWTIASGANPLRRDNPASFIIMTRGIAGSQVTLHEERSGAGRDLFMMQRLWVQTPV